MLLGLLDISHGCWGALSSSVIVVGLLPFQFTSFQPSATAPLSSHPTLVMSDACAFPSTAGLNVVIAVYEDTLLTAFVWVQLRQSFTWGELILSFKLYRPLHHQSGQRASQCPRLRNSQPLPLAQCRS